MHSAVQTAVVTIISYKPLSGLNFARYNIYRMVWQLHAHFPFGVYKSLPWFLNLIQRSFKNLKPVYIVIVHEIWHPLSYKLNKLTSTTHYSYSLSLNI